MSELEVLQQISTQLQGLQDSINYSIGIMGAMLGLCLAVLFALAWGHNTHV